MNEPKYHIRTEGPVAIFGGPYSNLEATRSFLNEVARLGLPATRIVCTGDVVAYGADAAATVALLREFANCEENLAAGAPDCGCGFEEGGTCDRLSGIWFAHATAEILPDDRAWMAALPRSIELEIGGYRFAVVQQGSTTSIDSSSHPPTPSSNSNSSTRRDWTA